MKTSHEKYIDRLEHRSLSYLLTGYAYAVKRICDPSLTLKRRQRYVTMRENYWWALFNLGVDGKVHRAICHV